MRVEVQGESAGVGQAGRFQDVVETCAQELASRAARDAPSQELLKAVEEDRPSPDFTGDYGTGTHIQRSKEHGALVYGGPGHRPLGPPRPAIEPVQSGADCPSDVATGAAICLASSWLTRHAPHPILRRWTSDAGTSVRCRVWRQVTSSVGGRRLRVPRIP
ncbi:hypothetical protein GCM10010256_73530 [Streptomyces coeruleorubidus]|nr:hypothetical protein GCM10010256_73530 [Streptomyces coeruleorubidus]